MCRVEANRSQSAIWSEGEEERAAIVEYDSKVPRAWVLSFLALSALVLITVSQPAGAAGSCERDPNHEPASLTFLRARLCLYSGDTVLSRDEFNVTPAQSKAECSKALAEFARFGLGPDDIKWLAPWDDPRYKLSQTRELISASPSLQQRSRGPICRRTRERRSEIQVAVPTLHYHFSRELESGRPGEVQQRPTCDDPLEV
jgi:hypothetical protein